MAKQTLTNGESGLNFRNALNSMFTELYSAVASAISALTVNATPTSGASSGDILTSDGSKLQKITPGTGVATALASNAGAAGGFATYSQLNAVATSGSASDLSAGTLAKARGGAGDVNGLMKANGFGVVSAASAGTDYVAPSGALGAATATSINKVAFTQPATGSTLTINDGKTFRVSATLTFQGTDSSTVSFGAGGTVAYTTAASWAALSVAAVTTFASLPASPSDGQLAYITDGAYTGTNGVLSGGGSLHFPVFYSSANSRWMSLLSPGNGANLTAGFSDQIYDAGTKSSGTFTPDWTLGNEQKYTNNGAHSLVPPVAAAGQRVRMEIAITNGGSAGALTLSGTNALFTFTGSISTTTLTTTGNPALAPGQVISGTGVTAGTAIVSGSGNSWTVSASQTVSSTTMTAGIAFDTNTSSTAAYATTTGKVFDAYIVAENAWASITIVGPR